MRNIKTKQLLKYIGIGLLCLVLFPIFPLVLGVYFAYKVYKSNPNKNRGAMLATGITVLSFVLTDATVSAFPSTTKTGSQNVTSPTVMPTTVQTFSEAISNTPAISAEPTITTEAPRQFVNTQTKSTATPKPTVTTQKATTSSYSCTGPDLDCSNFKTQKEAQSFFNSCNFSASYDPMKLDTARGDGNGVACESLP